MGGSVKMIELINDDCLKAMPGLKDKSIDLILTDPPPMVGRRTNGTRPSIWARYGKNGTEL